MSDFLLTKILVELQLLRNELRGWRPPPELKPPEPPPPPPPRPPTRSPRK